MPKHADILTLLADGDFHSGEQLAQHLSVSRSTVWKQIDAVREAGLDVYAVRGKGYRLEKPFELLDRDAILSHIIKAGHTPPAKLDVHWSLNSTNSTLSDIAKAGSVNGHTCLAERQIHGRGRRGRTWQSPIGGNIYLSQYWRLTDGLTAAGGVSLAAAVALIRALRSSGLVKENIDSDGAERKESIGVKWPNDIVYQNKKLAGILLEMTGDPSGVCHVIVGVGINCHLPASAAEKIDQPWTDLHSMINVPIDRNRLVAHLVTELLRVNHAVDQGDLESYLDEWRELDSYHGKNVIVDTPKGEFQGVVRGIDNSGALQLAHNGQLRSFHSGEVSLRKQTS